MRSKRVLVVLQHQHGAIQRLAHCLELRLGGPKHKSLSFASKLLQLPDLSRALKQVCYYLSISTCWTWPRPRIIFVAHPFPQFLGAPQAVITPAGCGCSVLSAQRIPSSPRRIVGAWGH